MRKLLLLGMLSVGTAGAINLSQLKLEDICWIPRNEFQVFRSLDEVAKGGLEQMPESMKVVLNSRLTDIGFSESHNCSYLLGTSIEIYQFSKSKVSSVEAGFSIYLNKIEDGKSINISNDYTVIKRLSTLEEKDVEFTSYYLLEALINAFIADWKQAHP